MISNSRRNTGSNSGKQLKDKKIQIIKKFSGKTPNGFPVNEYRPIHPGTLWAYFRHLSGNEFFSSAMINANEEVLFAINWRNDLDTDLIIQYKGVFYDITRIDSYEGYKDDLRLYAKLNTDQGIDVKPYQ